MFVGVLHLTWQPRSDRWNLTRLTSTLPSALVRSANDGSILSKHVQTTSDDIRRHLSSSFSVAFGPSGRMCQVVVAFVAPGTPARAVPGPLRFASLLLNTMIGSTIEPVDGSYDAVISACQKGLRILRFGYVWYFWCVWWLCTLHNLHNSEAYPCSYHRIECPSGPCSESI